MAKKRKAVSGDEEKGKKIRRDAEEIGDDDESSHPLLELGGEGSRDVCKSLMDRYAKSSAPQHRHLCASAVAMCSILQEEGLPLTPPAYFAAAITAIRDAPDDDPDAFAALSAFLSILLPLVPAQSLPPSKANDAASVLASILTERASGLATGTARSIVKSLGALTLLVNMDDWGAIELPLQTLLVFTLDRRPKVRKCAQICVEKVFKTLTSSNVIKKASKTMLSMFRKYIPLVRKSCSYEPLDGADQEELVKSEHFEAIQMLTLSKLVAQNLSKKVRMKILSDIHDYVGASFSLLTRHILGLMEVLLDHIEINIMVEELEKIISALSSFLSSGKKNSPDTTVAALGLLRKSLSMIHGAQPSLWIHKLPIIFKSVKGYMCSDDDTSENISEIIKEVINSDINWRMLLTTASQSSNEGKDTPETAAVVSLCSTFETMLDICNTPTKYMLAAISALFIKFGDFSYAFMKDILLKLSKWATETSLDPAVMISLQECIGSAVISMGPERVLSLIPISFDVNKLTCSNTWLVPILKRYVVGASLHFFVEHIVPVAKSVQDACAKVKSVTLCKSLQSYAHGLWELLPAFCHYPADTSRSFESVAKLLIDALRDDPSLDKTVALSLQVLVHENLSILDESQGQNLLSYLPTSSMTEYLHIHCESSPMQYSKETASKNIKVLSSNSMDLIRALTDIFIILPPERRIYPKEAIHSLAPLAKIEDIRNFFFALLEKFDLQKIQIELNGRDQTAANEAEKQQTSKTKENQDKRSLVIELAAAFIGKADEALIIALFNLIRTSLTDDNIITRSGGLFTLSIILKEQTWFCLDQTEDIMDLLHNVKTSEDSMVLKNQLLCYQFLLVHIIKKNDEKLNIKAFLILNGIILRLKSKKQSRKMAYDVLLDVYSSLKNTQPDTGESAIQRLITMVMGYLSSSSPHIISGAISALSWLVYHDVELCLVVPNLEMAVLALLQKKDTEVTKAALGFVKVIVSSLHPDDLMKLMSEILSGILPWSSISRWHFRSKVGFILEIMIRKCSFDAVVVHVPEKFKGFVKDVMKGLRSKKFPLPVANVETPYNSADPAMKRSKKRAMGNFSGPKKKFKDAASHVQKGSKKKHEKDKYGTANTAGAIGKEDRQQSLKRTNISKSKRVSQPLQRSLSYKPKHRKVDEKHTGVNRVDRRRKYTKQSMKS